MSPKRMALRKAGLKRQRVDNRPKTNNPNAELHLRKKQRTSSVNPPDWPLSKVKNNNGSNSSSTRSSSHEVYVDCDDIAVQSDSHDVIMASDLTACLINNDGIELVNLRNARDLAAAKQYAEQLIRANRAASTRKTYNQKVERWKRWCIERHFEDHDTVTENKLFFYLNSEVIPNGNQTQGKRKGAALSEQGLDGYIKPVVALYKVSP
jgi:hypothetical protein